MKINWGTAIVIVFVLFISYIMYMVVTMISAHPDMVETDYYAQQIDYQATKDATENGMNMQEPVRFEQTTASVDIVFPEQVKMNSIESGNVLFYRPENADLDREFELNPSLGNIQKIPMEYLSPGKYTVKIRWKGTEGEYLVEELITVD